MSLTHIGTHIYALFTSLIIDLTTYTSPARIPSTYLTSRKVAGNTGFISRIIFVNLYCTRHALYYYYTP